jgi:hypothetical protein
MICRRSCDAGREGIAGHPAPQLHSSPSAYAEPAMPRPRLRSCLHREIRRSQDGASGRAGSSSRLTTWHDVARVAEPTPEPRADMCRLGEARESGPPRCGAAFPCS